MKFSHKINPESGEVVMTMETNLLKRYYLNLYGLIEKYKDSLQGLKIKKETDNKASLYFAPMVNPQKDVITKLNKILNTFVNSGLKKELKTTEFIPLEGYSISNMQDEILNAVKGKRKLCIIKDYQEFLDSGTKKGNYMFHQYMIEYGTDEYYNAVILISGGDFDTLTKMYKPKLKLESWD